MATKTTKVTEAKKDVKKVEKATKAESNVFTTDSLVRAISAKSAIEGKPKYSLTECADIVSMFKESVMDALKEGKKVQLTGFINITPSYRKARVGNNVLTHEKMDIPAYVSYNVKAGKAMKDIAKNLPADVVERIKNG